MTDAQMDEVREMMRAQIKGLATIAALLTRLVELAEKWDAANKKGSDGR